MVERVGMREGGDDVLYGSVLREGFKVENSIEGTGIIQTAVNC